MEHIVQFGITIDDQAIKDRIEHNATKQIVGTIADGIKEKLFNRYGGATDMLKGILAKQVVEPFADQIVKEAVKQLVDTIKRSKKYKEALAQIAEESINE